MKKKGGLFTGVFGGVVCLVLFAVAGYQTYQTLTTAGKPVAKPIEAVFMCSETGKTFDYKMTEGEHWPVLSPYSHKLTGYPTEPCYWTRDGKRKSKPTYVILNEHLGKPGDTICPECGRVVIGHNPLPPANVPLAPETAAATKPAVAPVPAPKPGAAKPATPHAENTPSTSEGGAGPPGSGSVASQANHGPTGNEAVVYATIRARMQEMIEERARMLKENRPPTDAAVRELEASILRGKQMLTEAGEVPPPIEPPIAEPASATE